MLMHNNRNGAIVVKSGGKTVVFKQGAFEDLEESAAKTLMKMYPGLVTEAKAEPKAEELEANEPLVKAAEEQEAEAEADTETEQKGQKKNASSKRK